MVTRAFLFFAYPAAMSGDQVFVRTADTFGIGGGQVVDGFSGATPLGQVAIAGKELIGSFQAVDVLGHPISTWDMFLGLIPGSIGETSVLAILIGAVILLSQRSQVGKQWFPYLWVVRSCRLSSI